MGVKTLVWELARIWGKNIDDDKSEVIFEASELDGLSPGELNNLKKKDNNFLVTMAYPDVNAVMENCKIRKSRKKVYCLFQTSIWFRASSSYKKL